MYMNITHCINTKCDLYIKVFKHFRWCGLKDEGVQSHAHRQQLACSTKNNKLLRVSVKVLGRPVQSGLNPGQTSPVTSATSQQKNMKNNDFLWNVLLLRSGWETPPPSPHRLVWGPQRPRLRLGDLFSHTRSLAGNYKDGACSWAPV